MYKTYYEHIISIFPGYHQLFTELDKEDLPDGFSFAEYEQTRVFAGLAGRLTGDQSVVATALHTLFHTYSFYRNAGRVYEVSENIAEMLLNTNLDIDSSIVKSPFSEIIIAVPPNTIEIYNEYSGFHEVYNIYVNLHEGPDGKIIRVFCAGKPKNDNKYDDAVFYFKIGIGSGKISDSVKKECYLWQASDVYLEYIKKYDPETFPIERIFHFVINVLLYITSSDSDIRHMRSEYPELESGLGNIKSPAKIRRFKSKLDRTSKLDRYVIGSSIKLSSEEHEFYNGGRRHTIRYPVGGHFRLQWYGPRDNQHQKHIWIRPHFRGPELAELIRSVGVLK